MNAAVPEPSLSALVRLRFVRALAPAGVSSALALSNLCIINCFHFNNWWPPPRFLNIETRSHRYDLEHSEFEETISLSRMKSLIIALAGPQAWFGSEGV